MLTSLFSYYIISILQPNWGIDIPLSLEKNPIVITAEKDFLSPLENLAYAPTKDPHYISPIIGARSSIAIDFKSGTTLYEKNAHQKLEIASITKLMTILIILEENKTDEVVTVSKNAAYVEGSTMFLAPGEEITIENLLKGALIHSANDAAYALAEHNAGSIKAFVEKMNKKADALGLLNTHFANPAGLDNPNNYSSAYDVAKMARYIYQKKFIRDTAIQKELAVRSVDGKYTHKLISTNDLLGSYLNIKGLKTGSTGGAGECLVSVAEDNNNEIISVVLNSPARFTESKILLDWVFRAYQW